MFYKEIDLNNEEEMRQFLTDHFKYHTYRSWNCSKSFAHNVKLHNLDLPNLTKAFEILEVEDSSYLMTEHHFDDFKDENPGYSISFNGRSGGYLVLYSEKNGRDISNLDIEELEIDDLKFYTQLVMNFDQTVDAIRDELIQMCEDYEVVTETINIPKEIKVLKPLPDNV